MLSCSLPGILDRCPLPWALCILSLIAENLHPFLGQTSVCNINICHWFLVEFKKCKWASDGITSGGIYQLLILCLRVQIAAPSLLLYVIWKIVSQTYWINERGFTGCVYSSIHNFFGQIMLLEYNHCYDCKKKKILKTLLHCILGLASPKGWVYYSLIGISSVLGVSDSLEMTKNQEMTD